MSNEFFNYMPFYRYVAGISRYRDYVEIGCFTGASTAFLARQLLDRMVSTQMWGSGFKLYAVDLWEQVNIQTDYERKVDGSVWDQFDMRMMREGLHDHVIVVKDDSAKAAVRFEDASVDFVFIDANHSYEHVKADIEAWRPKVRVGGMLAGHDYGEPCGVKQAVDELLGGTVTLMGTCWYTFIR